MIRELPNQIAANSGGDDLVLTEEDSTLSLEKLVGALTSHEDRCLAARVAYLVAAVSRQPRDRHKINSDERRVYQELVQQLKLSKDDLEGIECSAKEELNQNRSPIRLIMDLIF